MQESPQPTLILETTSKPGSPPRRVELRMAPMGLVIKEGTDLDEWKLSLASWKRIKEMFHFGLADLLRYGKAKFGEPAVMDALGQFEFEFTDGSKAFAIGQIPLDLRVAELSSEHYYVLGKADLTAKERGRWAALAHQHQLTAYELKLSIENGKLTRQDDVDEVSGKGAGINTIQGISFWFGRWQNQVGGKKTVLGWPEKKKQEWLGYVKPIVDLALEVVASLKKK